jgi:hypothetical protein
MTPIILGFCKEKQLGTPGMLWSFRSCILAETVVPYIV